MTTAFDDRDRDHARIESGRTLGTIAAGSPRVHRPRIELPPIAAPSSHPA